MTMEGTGIVPVMDMNNCNRGYGDGYGMMGGGMWFMWIIVIFALMWGNNGWGNRNNGDLGLGAAVFANGTATRNEIAEQFNAQDIKNGIRGVQNGLCDGFYAQNTTMLQGFNGVGRELCQGFAGVGAAIAENRFAAQQCCCDLKGAIKDVQAEAYRNTCDITNAIHHEGELTRALINANTMQDLRDKLADRDRDLQTANFQLSQQAQSANLISVLRPTPIPSYPVCSPYESSRIYDRAFDRGFYGNGYNNGCGCGNC